LQTDDTPLNRTIYYKQVVAGLSISHILYYQPAFFIVLFVLSVICAKPYSFIKFLKNGTPIKKLVFRCREDGRALWIAIRSEEQEGSSPVTVAITGKRASKHGEKCGVARAG
jgi:hypothetical protein